VDYTARRRQKIFEATGLYGNQPKWRIELIRDAIAVARNVRIA
jgi:hypothetical protein